jgi:hypothetical protein
MIHNNSLVVCRLNNWVVFTLLSLMAARARHSDLRWLAGAEPSVLLLVVVHALSLPLPPQSGNSPLGALPCSFGSIARLWNSGIIGP